MNIFSAVYSSSEIRSVLTVIDGILLRVCDSLLKCGINAIKVMTVRIRSSSKAIANSSYLSIRSLNIQGYTNYYNFIPQNK